MQLDLTWFFNYEQKSWVSVSLTVKPFLVFTIKHLLFVLLKGLWLCDSRKKRFFFENQYYLVTNVFRISKLIFWYLSMSSINLAIRFKHGLYLFNRYNTSFKWIANQKFFLRNHKIDCYAQYTCRQQENTGLRKILF